MKKLMIEVVTEIVTEWLASKNMSDKERKALTALYVAIGKLLRTDKKLDQLVQRESAQ